MTPNTARIFETNSRNFNRQRSRGRISIHPPSLKWPLSLRGTSGERAGERGSFHRIVALLTALPNPPHFSVVGRGK